MEEKLKHELESEGQSQLGWKMIEGMARLKVWGWDCASHEQLKPYLNRYRRGEVVMRASIFWLTP